MVTPDAFIIRKYRPSDRERVRQICCETGFLGKPIDPVFEDRDLFADFLVNYYVDEEPESAFIIERGGMAVGYLLGSRDQRRHKIYFRRKIISLITKALVRFSTYQPESKRFILWMLFHGWRETPPAPKNLPHFHINLLPEARTVQGTRQLIDSFLLYLKACSERGVYGQMVTFGNRRGERMFERFGFTLINRSEITKYRRFHPEPVYLCTVVKDLTRGATLYARQD